MPRIEERRQVTTTLPITEARARLLAAFAARKANMATVREDYLEGRTGSQTAVRLKGGWLARPEQFPLVAAVDLAAVGSGTLVRLTVADDLGFGLKTGVKKKYTHAVETLASQLVASLSVVADSACPLGHPASPGAQFCASCGRALAS